MFAGVRLVQARGSSSLKGEWNMSNQDNPTRSPKQSDFGRRGFLYTVVGGLAAALASCVPGGFTKEPTPTPTGEPLTEPSASRISALEAKVAHLELGISALLKIRPLGQLAGANDERVVFNKNELTVINPEGSCSIWLPLMDLSG
jgi:hypothetical protein